jgi:hypothetical protein
MPIKFFLAFCLLLILCQTFIQAQISNEQRVNFTVPSAPWSLTLPKDNLVIKKPQFKPDGQSGYFSMYDEKNKMNISFFIEPAIKCKDSKSCRDMVWKLGNPAWENPKNIIQSEIEGYSYFEFLMPSFQGTPVNQQNMYVQIVKDNFWIDLHLSKVLYKPQERELFERVIKSIKFHPKNPNIKNRVEMITLIGLTLPQ